MKSTSPTTVPHLRPLNRALVLRVLRDRAPLPRSELARSAGVSPTTITKLAAKLIEDDWIVETSVESTGSVGRPAINIALRRDRLVVCGVQVGVGFVRLGVTNLFAEVEHSDGFTFEPDKRPEAVIEMIATRLEELLGTHGLEPDAMLGVGIAAPGAVDAEHRLNVMALNLGWRDVDFATPLEQALGIPVTVEHNVRAMALAEARYGVAKGRDSLCYVYVRTGIGAGLIVDGEPFTGGVHGVCELGHLRVVSDGPRCPCGATGCLETVVAEPVLAARAAAAVEHDPDGVLAMRLAEGRPLLAAIDDAAATGDAAADAILAECVEHLTTGLASVVNLLNPELIVLGGLFVDAPDTTFERVRKDLANKTFPVLRDSVRVERSGLGLDAGMAGAAAAALEQFFYRAPAPA